MKSPHWLLASLMLTLSACTVTVDEGNPPPHQAPRPGICPRIYQPVCATRFGERDTFPNACVAQSNGFDVIHRGECRRRPIIIDAPITPRPHPPRPTPVEPGVVCPQIYAPVCAAQAGLLRTFPNACIAQGSGFRVVDDGPC